MFRSSIDNWKYNFQDLSFLKKKKIIAPVDGIQRFLVNGHFSFLVSLEKSLLVELNHIYHCERIFLAQKVDLEWWKFFEKN